MGSRQYIIPTDGMTLSDQKELRANALAAGIQRSIEVGIGTWDKTEFPSTDSNDPNRPDFKDVKAKVLAGTWPASLDVREFQPIADAGSALDQWITAALAAVGTLYSCLQAVATAPIATRANKLLVIYKVGIATTNFPVSRLVFRNVAAGNFLAEYDLEPLRYQMIPEGYLSEPFVIDPNMTFAIQVMARVATAAVANIIPGNFLFEPTGQTHA